MFSLVLFALLAVATSVPVQSHGGYGGYRGYSGNSGYGGYSGQGGYSGALVAPKYPVAGVAQAYGAHQRVAPVSYSGAVHAAPADEYARDYNIEQFGEKYAYQNAPGATFQYSFIRGADSPSHSGVAAYAPAVHSGVSAYAPAVHSGVAAYGVPAVHSGVASFGVPHEQRFSEALPQYGSQYGSQYAGVVAPVNSFGHLKATHDYQY